MKFPIYLDYSATTPVDPRVAQKMIPYLTEMFGNAASRSHAYGWDAEKVVEEARGHVAALLNADPQVAKAMSMAELDEVFDLGYHTKNVDVVFDRVFGQA